MSQSQLQNVTTQAAPKLWHSAMPVPLYCPSLLALAPAHAIELAATWHDPLTASRNIEEWVGERRRGDLPEPAVTELMLLYELLERSVLAACWPEGTASQ